MSTDTRIPKQPHVHTRSHNQEQRPARTSRASLDDYSSEEEAGRQRKVGGSFDDRDSSSDDSPSALRTSLDSNVVEQGDAEKDIGQNHKRWFMWAKVVSHARSSHSHGIKVMLTKDA